MKIGHPTMRADFSTYNPKLQKETNVLWEKRLLQRNFDFASWTTKNHETFYLQNAVWCSERGQMQCGHFLKSAIARGHAYAWSISTRTELFGHTASLVEDQHVHTSRIVLKHENEQLKRNEDLETEICFLNDYSQIRFVRRVFPERGRPRKEADVTQGQLWRTCDWHKFKSVPVRTRNLLCKEGSTAWLQRPKC